MDASRSRPLLLCPGCGLAAKVASPKSAAALDNKPVEWVGTITVKTWQANTTEGSSAEYWHETTYTLAPDATFTNAMANLKAKVKDLTADKLQDILRSTKATSAILTYLKPTIEKQHAPLLPSACRSGTRA